MNVGDEFSSPSSHTLKDPQQIQSWKNVVLRPEEVKAYKECIHGLYYKAGIPFAVFCQFVTLALRKTEKLEFTPQALIKRGALFFGNVILGTILFTPVCYNKMVAMRAEFEKRNKDLQGQEIFKHEGAHPVTQAEDFSYPADLISSLNEPEGSFSLDFSTSKPLSDDIGKLSTPSPPTTTYEELRARHRNSYSKSEGSSLNLKQDPQLGTYSAPLEKPVTSEIPPPQRIVKKNKYGDEIE